MVRYAMLGHDANSLRKLFSISSKLASAVPLTAMDAKIACSRCCLSAT